MKTFLYKDLKRFSVFISMEKIKNCSSANISKINDVIFKELLKRGYSLEGKNRVWNIADSKLWYLTPEQAQAFLELETKDPKQVMFAKKEMELLKNNFKQISSEVHSKNINIIDLGCGNGEKALFFVKNFKDKSKIRYCPIDISNFMVERALKTLSKVKSLQLVNFKHNIIDFLDLDQITSTIKKGAFKTNMLLLLGGSLENSDVHELLHDIRSAMKDDDCLLIGNKLTHPNPEKMVAYYNSNKHIDNMLIKTIEKIGLSKEDVSYGARYRGSRVEMYYTLKKDKVISHNGKKVDFRIGDKIITTISYKYNKDSFLETLNLYFNDVELFISKDGIYALALCKK